MAEALDDGEFWLPSEFLTDDDILMETQKGDSGARFCFPSEFPYGFPAYGNSPPVEESLLGSTETESDEDDYLAGFTRQMARSLLHQAENNDSSVFSTDNNPKTRVMAGSPQSPLCGVGSWSINSTGSSKGSPTNPSQVSSPPETPLNVKDDAWDLLFAAAGQVVRMQMNDEGGHHKYGRGLLAPQKQKVSHPVSLPSKNNSNGGCYSNQDQTLAQHQLQANHFYQLKQHQQQCSDVWGRQVKPIVSQNQPIVPNGGRSVGFVNGIGNGRCNTRPLGLPPSAWPPLQNQPQQNGSGMRAVFLGGSGARRESSGTGVFLPRRNGNPSESRRKPACSTVLLPARVVQALNLNFEEMGAGAVSQPRYNGGFHGNAAFLSQQQKRNYRPQLGMNPSEVQLPQEWTY